MSGRFAISSLLPCPQPECLPRNFWFLLSLSFLEEKEKIPQSTLGSFGVVLHKTPDLALVAGQPGLEGGKDMAIYEKVLCLYIIAASNANGGVCL